MNVRRLESKDTKDTKDAKDLRDKQRVFPRSFVASLLSLVSLVSLTPPPLAAQSAPGIRLTLAEALERARTTSPRLESLSALEEAAEAARRGALAERLPTVDLVTGYIRNSAVEEFSITLPGVGTQTLFPNILEQLPIPRRGLAAVLYGRAGGEHHHRRRPSARGRGPGPHRRLERPPAGDPRGLLGPRHRP